MNRRRLALGAVLAALGLLSGCASSHNGCDSGCGNGNGFSFSGLFSRMRGRNLNKSSTSGKDEEEWGVIPDKVVKLTAKEREDLGEAQRDAEIIPRPDRPAKVNKSNFKDRQLDSALEYLRGQIKMASRVPPRKKAG